MSQNPISDTFSPLSEWIFRIVPIVISIGGVIYSWITRYDNRKKLTIRWSSEMTTQRPGDIGDPALVIHLHNTGRRKITLVSDSYYFVTKNREHYILELDPILKGRSEYAGLMHEGDSFAIAIRLTDFISRIIEKDKSIAKGDLICIGIKCHDVEGKKYISKAKYSISGWGLVEKDEMYRARLHQARQLKKNSKRKQEKRNAGKN
jgi:hypothetical protein